MNNNHKDCRRWAVVDGCLVPEGSTEPPKPTEQTKIAPKPTGLTVIGPPLHRCALCGSMFVAYSDFEAHWKQHQNVVVTVIGYPINNIKIDQQVQVKTEPHSPATEPSSEGITGAQLEQGVWTCNACKREFLTASAMRTHLKTHTKAEGYECVRCREKFTSYQAMLEHRTKTHGRQILKCKHCPLTFVTQKKRAEHQMAEHKAERPHVCSVCEKRFTSNSDLTIHMRQHTGEKPVECSRCDKKFSCRSQLSRHMRYHTGELKYQCEICQKRFMMRENLLSHLYNTHSEVKEFKPYSCSICGKPCKTTEDLKIHERRHTGKKFFACKLCDKAYTSRGGLLKHLDTHTGIQYLCEVCGKSFSQKGYLSGHIKAKHSEGEMGKPKKKPKSLPDNTNPGFLRSGRKKKSAEDNQTQQ